MTMGELATLLRVKPPTVSKTIGRLSLQGLVTREGGNRDGRLVQVALTETGQKTAATLDAVWNQVEEELLERLDAQGAQATAQAAAQGRQGIVESRRRGRGRRSRRPRMSTATPDRAWSACAADWSGRTNRLNLVRHTPHA